MPPPEENYKTEIVEMARIACAAIPDDLCEQMDISDELFISVREYLAKTTQPTNPTQPNPRTT